uniref:Uncharacterized protein n=1 Tax=Triticum urartu TaxID=4572 RepID=A0A8R7R0W2_TRIUA
FFTRIFQRSLPQAQGAVHLLNGGDLTIGVVGWFPELVPCHEALAVDVPAAHVAAHHRRHLLPVLQRQHGGQRRRLGPQATAQLRQHLLQLPVVVVAHRPVRCALAVLRRSGRRRRCDAELGFEGPHDAPQPVLGGLWRLVGGRRRVLQQLHQEGPAGDVGLPAADVAELLRVAGATDSQALAIH